MKFLSITAAALAAFSTALAAPPDVTRNTDIAGAAPEVDAAKCHYDCEYEFMKCMRAFHNDKGLCKGMWCISLGKGKNCKHCKHCNE